MTTDRYADAGLYYLPIDRIDEFPECKDGREVLMRVEYGYGEERLLTIVCTFNADDGLWVDQDGCSQLTPTHFLPASLTPIGEHVVVECEAFIHSPSGKMIVQGSEGHSLPEVLAHTREATITVRIPIRRPPHGEAM